MIRLKFPITTFSLCSQSNPASKTRSLMLLMFSKFDSTSSLTEVTANRPIVLWHDCCFHLFVYSYAQVDRWKSYFPYICYGCSGGCGRNGTSSGG
ncbi:unnamed protein product, partial [Prunus brigantina]